MTINDLAFEMISDKEDIEGIRKLEKQIKSWEKEKSYPTLEDIYTLAYIIKINPGELLAIRNRGRKQFYRESDDPPVKRHDWIQISDDASIIFSCVIKSFSVFVIIIVVVVLYKFQDTFFGATASSVEFDVMEKQIQKGIGENIINDGTVANMLRRKRKEALENSTNITTDVENELENVVE